MLSSCISFNICLKNISGRLANNGFQRERDGFSRQETGSGAGRVFPSGNGFRSGTGFVQLEWDRDRDGCSPVGAGSGSGRKNIVPPDPNLEVVLVIVKLSEFYHLLSTWIIFQLVVKTYRIDVSCFVFSWRFWGDLKKIREMFLLCRDIVNNWSFI